MHHLAPRCKVVAVSSVGSYKLCRQHSRSCTGVIASRHRLAAAQVAETATSPATTVSTVDYESSVVSSMEEPSSSSNGALSYTQPSVPPPHYSKLFHASHISSLDPLLLLYFPFGCTLAGLRFALWISCIALDAPWFRHKAVIDAWVGLMGVTVTWKGTDNIPQGSRHVLVSNHVTVADLLILFQRPDKYVHLITSALPGQVYAAKHLPAMLRPASKDMYEQLAAGVNQGHPLVKPGLNGHAATSSISEDLAAPVHVFPEGGMTNGAGMMRFSRGFMRFAADLPVVPVAIKSRPAFPNIHTHTLTSSFLANLFWFCFMPWTEIEATALPAMQLQPGEHKTEFVRQVQTAIANELGIGVADINIQQKRKLMQR
eukprot:jgi/Chrzof1/1627/Cz10g14320.t1